MALEGGVGVVPLARDVIVQLLVSPGQLFAGYGDTSGPMEARFRIAVQNAVPDAGVSL
jgi:hypothetical protein